MLRKSNEAKSKPPVSKVRGKLSYGWIVALAGGITVLAAANFQYSFGVFLKPLINQFGWSRTAISGCVSARSILSGVMSPISGNLSDRYGPRKLIFVGVLLVGLGYLSASRISSLWQLYFSLSILTGIGIGFFFTPVVATATKWFGGKSGLANGIVMSGFGMAQIIIPPVATYLILQYSWETCFIILGMATLGVGIIAWSFIRNPPQSMTNPPPGKPTGAGEVSKDEKTPATDYYTLSEALRTPTLWLMLLIYMTTAICYQMVVIHIVVAAIDTGITPEAAALILTLGGITNTAGRLIVGGLANKFGTKIVLALCLAVQAPVLFFLAGASDLHVFYIIATVFGFAYAGTSPIMPTMAAVLFGTRSVGSIFGTLNLAYTTGVAIGPLLAGYIFDATGSYSAAFLSAAVAMAISFILCLLLKQPKKKALAA